MRILALDSSVGACSVAIGTGDGTILARKHEVMARGQSEHLAPMTEAVLAEAGIGSAELDVIAVTRGPGAFTGIRLGLAAARGLGLALGIPVLGYATTKIIAAAQTGIPEAAALLVLIDSKRGDFHTQMFRNGTAEAPVALDKDALIGVANRNPELVLAGDAAENAHRILADAGIDTTVSDGPALPDACTLARLCADQTSVNPSLLRGGSPPEPLYLRAPDVSAPDRDRARAPKSASFATSPPDGMP